MEQNLLLNRAAPPCSPMACTPTTFAYRISLLVFIGLLTLGSYFCYDQPGALPGPFTLYLAQNSTEKFSLMYSIYSFPNIVLPFLGGWLIDYVLGERLGMSMCVTLVFAGNLMVALAATWSTADTEHNLYPFLIAIGGRFVYGLGAETLTVAQSAIITKWFLPNERNTAFALVLALSRVGSAINLQLETPIYEHWNKQHQSHLGFVVVCWLGCLLCGISVLCGAVVFLLDKYGEAQCPTAMAVIEEEAQPEEEQE